MNRGNQRRRNRRRLSWWALLQPYRQRLWRWRKHVARLGGLVCLGLALIFLLQYLRRCDELRLHKITLLQHDGSMVPSFHHDNLLTWMNLTPLPSMLQLNLDELARKAESYPWVRNVVIQRRWPNQLMVWVELHQARLLIALHSLWVVNLQGEIFKPLQPQDRLALPVLTGFTTLWQQDPQAMQLLMQQTLALSTQLEQQAAHLGSLEEIHWDEDLGISVALRDGFARQRVLMHLGHSPEHRVGVALQVLKWCQQQQWMAKVIWADAIKNPQRLGVQLQTLAAPPIREGGS